MLPIQWKKVTSLTESRESLQRRRHANPNLTKRIAWVLFIEMRESPSLAAPKLYNLCSVEIVFHSNHHVFLIYVLSKKRRKQGTMKKPENNVTKNFFVYTISKRYDLLFPRHNMHLLSSLLNISLFLSYQH